MVKIINRQLYTYKFKSSRLKKFKYDIIIDFEQSKKNKELIMLADSQILRSIRDINNVEIDFEKLEILFELKKTIGRKSKEIYNEELFNKYGKLFKTRTEIQTEINNTLFIEDYISVVIEHASHYKYLFEKGLIINGKTFKRLSCSAGQARMSTIVMCNEEIIDELNKRLNNGRNLNKPFSPSKFNAYFGLYGSATKKVSEPRFIVIKDFENKHKFKTNFVVETDWDKDDEIIEKEIEIDMNRTDGMGLISPNMAQQWAIDLGLDWIPSQFCIRQSFLKGMLCVFDIHKFCKEKNNDNYIINTIYKDTEGKYITADLRDVDVIITESQFKLWDSYVNINEYIENYRNNKLYWGISQYTPKEANDILKLNYQFIQTLNLNKNNIENLASQFINWIENVNGDNMYYTLLFLLGLNTNKNKIKDYLNNSDNYWIKSLIVNHNLINDKYIRQKIYDLVKIRIENGCLGSIFVDGNFQVLVSDPYAFMEHACGLEVKGLLKGGECFSNYWNEKKINKIDCMRSPLTFYSEHRLMNLVNNKDIGEWYKWCKLGIIFSYFSNESVHFGGSDFDFDILASTCNKEIINGIFTEELSVSYDAPKPKKIMFTDKDLFESDNFSFGSIIGQITNKSSSAYALLPILKNKYGVGSEQYKITISRLKQCCKAQSAQIDKTKIGKSVKGIPSIWTNDIKEKKDEVGNNIETKDEFNNRIFYNSVILNKHPYFFKYLYKDTKKKINKYMELNNIACFHKFGMSFNEICVIIDKTDDMIDFINKFYEYIPVYYSDSSMNLLCKYIEEKNFNIKQKIKIPEELLNLNIYKTHILDDLYDNEKLNLIKKKAIVIINTFLKNKQQEKNTTSSNYKNKYNSDEHGGFVISVNILKQSLSEICDNEDVIVNILIDYFYLDRINLNKDLLWEAYGKNIFDNIRNNSNDTILFPMPNLQGDILYLNKKYILEEVSVR